MDLAATRKLSNTQTEAFDVEYVNDGLWQVLEPFLAEKLDGPGRFLDVGGGNGMLVDRILNAFPKSEGVNLEPAPNLVLANKLNLRKEVIALPLQELDENIGQFDVITINWVLHHLVAGRYAETRTCQIDALRNLKRLMKPGAYLLAFENIYEGQIIDEGPSRIIHGLTASKILASLTARLGANTAGVGVCFHSKKGWQKIFRDSGLDVFSIVPCYRFGALSRLKKTALHLDESLVGFFAAKTV